MELVPTVALLLHPLLASALVVWMWWQYAWRKKSYELKGEERALHLARHEPTENAFYGRPAWSSSWRLSHEVSLAGTPVKGSLPQWFHNLFTASWVPSALA